jgi:RND family efflux transporter MFP subunit
MTRNLRATLLTIGGAALALLVAMIAWSRFQDVPRAISGVEHRPAAVAIAPVSGTGWVGVLLAPEVVTLTAPADGRLAELTVQLGDRVEQGQVVARLNDVPLRRELEKARARRAVREAELARAKVAASTSHDRLARSEKAARWLNRNELEDQRLASRTAQSDLEVANANLEEASAAVAELDASIHDVELRAPFAGVVSERYVDPGATVRLATPIVRLVQEGAPRVRFAIPQEEVGQLSVGAPVLVAIAGGEPLTGRVTRLSPELDPASLTLTAEASLPAGGGLAVPRGQLVRVQPGAAAALRARRDP